MTLRKTRFGCVLQLQSECILATVASQHLTVNAARYGAQRVCAALKTLLHVTSVGGPSTSVIVTMGQECGHGIIIFWGKG